MPDDDLAALRAWRKEQRAALVTARLALSADEHQRASAAIDRHLTTHFAVHPARNVGVYWPIRAEFDIRPLAERLRSAGTTISLPVVIGKANPLEFRIWDPAVPLAVGVFDIAYPPQGEPQQPEVLIIPLLGFDAGAYRLGYGAGYYDRTLVLLAPKPRAIGVGFECGRLSTIRPQPYDVPMDLVVTEAGSFSVSS